MRTLTDPIDANKRIHGRFNLLVSRKSKAYPQVVSAGLLPGSEVDVSTMLHRVPGGSH